MTYLRAQFSGGEEGQARKAPVLQWLWQAFREVSHQESVHQSCQKHLALKAQVLGSPLV